MLNDRATREPGSGSLAATACTDCLMEQRSNTGARQWFKIENAREATIPGHFFECARLTANGQLRCCAPTY